MPEFKAMLNVSERRLIEAAKRGEAIDIEFDTFILRIKGKAVELQDIQWGTL